MEPEHSPDYHQLLEEIHRLPQNDFEKLVRTLSQELNEKKRSSTNLQSLILKAPIWSDEQWEAYQEARQHINQSRLG